MKKSAFVLSLILVFTVEAAIAAPNAYLRSDGDVFVKGTVYKRTFWSGYDLSQSLADNPEAQAFYEKHRRSAEWGSVFVWGGLAAALGYSLSTVNSGNYNSNTYWMIFGIPFTIGIFFGAHSHRSLMRAINVYEGVPSEQAWLQRKNRFELVRNQVMIPVLNLSF